MLKELIEESTEIDLKNRISTLDMFKVRYLLAVNEYLTIKEDVLMLRIEYNN